MNNTTAARFIDVFRYNLLPPFEYEYMALSFSDHRGYVRGYKNPYSSLADEEIASFMGDVVVPDAPQVVQVNVLQDMDNPRKYTSIISIAVDATMPNQEAFNLQGFKLATHDQVPPSHMIHDWMIERLD